MGKKYKIKGARPSEKGKRFAAKSKMKTATGIFQSTSRGFGFVTPDGEEDAEDIFIPKEYTNNAWNRDRVEVKVLPAKGKHRREGIVKTVMVRGTTRVVGTFEQNKNFGFVVPDDLKLHRDIFIPKDLRLDAKDGDKVVCEITDYQGAGGKIIEVLGAGSDPGMDIFSIAYSMGIPMNFPPKAMNQAERCQTHVIEGDFSGREDLRSWQLVTIDGPDAKDIDDAVSLTETESGYELGVHIADVSNYVQEGSALDREALKRGTSVYLADRVIPMLPVQLSNGICSLNAGVDRLALSVIMEMNRGGEVVSHRIVESVIRVGERMSYPDVRAILEDHDEALAERYHDYVPMFERMYELSQKIRARRRERGSIDFDFPEAKIVLDKNGVPTDIVAEEANVATRLIEDFMLTANETVAQDFCEKKIPFLYRIHEDPDPDKIEDLIAFVRKNGVKIEKNRQKITPKEIQRALERIKGEPNEALISRVILRSMQQARYDTECSGHFGLAAKYYCHFTSPIRRYPDLQIHRIIHDVIRGRMTEERKQHYRDLLGDVAVRTSQTERRADECERETEKLKKAQYMSTHIGEEFDGVISGVTGWGLYVELPNTVEGLVPASEMKDDYYIFSEEDHSMTGRLSGRTFVMGDPVRVRVKATDLRARTIDFVLA